MPIIEFPDVPVAPGVPNLKRTLQGLAVTSQALPILESYDYFGIANQFLKQDWGIFDQGGNAVLSPDSVVSFEYKGEQRVSYYPIEKGSFASYNKVALPFDIRMRMTCGGQGVMTRAEFISSLKGLLASIGLYNIVTPEDVYSNVSLDHVDYQKTAKNGVSLITVDAWFSEIRVTAQAQYSNTVQPSGMDAVNIGRVNSIMPTVSQLSQYIPANIQ